jgi:penicillin amidase
MTSSDNANVLIAQDINSDESDLLKQSMKSALEKAVYYSNRYESWGDLHRLQLKHVLGNIPVLGKRFQFSDFPTDGSVNTVMKTAHQITDERHGTFYGANSRYISRMKDPDENYFVLLGGQDGWLGSDYFLDHVPLWRRGQYIRIPLTIDTIKKSFTTKMRLLPENK